MQILFFRAGSAGGPKLGRVGFYLGVVRHRADSPSSAVNAPATLGCGAEDFRSWLSGTVAEPLCRSRYLLRLPHGSDEQRVILALGHSARADHLPKSRHTALASSAECLRFIPKPESVTASGTAPPNLPVARSSTTVPGERIVSVSLVEVRVAFTK